MSDAWPAKSNEKLGDEEIWVALTKSEATFVSGGLHPT